MGSNRNKVEIGRRLNSNRLAKHGDLVRQIAHEGLWRRLECFQGNGSKLVKHWIGMRFTPNGILAPSQAVGFHDDLTHLAYEAFATPDLMLLASSPPHLRIVKAKCSDTFRGKQDTERQLTNAREYVQKNPRKIYAFLEQQGMQPEDIYRLTVGFSGVTATRNKGIKETVYDPEGSMATLLG
ncbi:MAG: hypothetical protein ABH864_05310 [archaeon]